MNDKSALLQQLRIDPNDKKEQQGLKAWHLLLSIVLTVIVTLLISRSFFSSTAQPVNTTKQNASAGPATAPATNAAKTESANDAPAVKIPTSDAVLNASGYITARRMATVSAEIMGLITEVNVEEGMSVESGQVLARLDDALAKVSLDLANAHVQALQARREALQAELSEARRNLERVTKNQYSSEAERTQAQTQVQSLSAGLQSAVADIQVASLEAKGQQERLDDHTIRAPFAGVVTVKNAQPGEIVAPTSAGGGFTRTGICTIVDMQSLEIEVDVNESFIGKVSPGQQVEARLDAYPDWVIPASVIAIIPTADRAKATVQVRIKLETNDPRILPDMGVKVAFLKA
ncbi:efflux RND transporter periplasmic adaptor subunit [Aliiglaciecola sp. CAU 1673]|nr:efflux RND transporter periplasmic adaptor subunit [Aliiglaciecola sp. CAU 1673]